jgi:Protein of unknown function (DUF1275)
MSSLDIAASPPIRRDETVQIALLLVFAGGHLDAYTYIIHGVMANAHTANLVLLWVHRSLRSSDYRIQGGRRNRRMATPLHWRSGQRDQHAVRDHAGGGRYPVQSTAGYRGGISFVVRIVLPRCEIQGDEKRI